MRSMPRQVAGGLMVMTSTRTRIPVSTYCRCGLFGGRRDESLRYQYLAAVCMVCTGKPAGLSPKGRTIDRAGRMHLPGVAAGDTRRQPGCLRAPGNRSFSGRQGVAPPRRAQALFRAGEGPVFTGSDVVIINRLVRVGGWGVAFACRGGRV